MAIASSNQFPKVILEEVANDGSATVTPAADHRALFLGEDGGLHLKDSAGAVTDLGAAGLADQGEFTFLDGVEAAAPATPAAGRVRVYAKADGLLYSKDDAGTETLVSGGAGGGGSGAVGRTHIAVPFGYVHDKAQTSDNIAVNACWAAPVDVPAPMYLDHLRYRNNSTSLERAIEFALYYDDGTANAVRVAHGSETFTPTVASLQTPAFDSAPVTLDPGTYWLVIRNSHASNVLAIGFQSLETALFIRQMTKAAIGALSGATLDLSTGWTRTSTNIPMVGIVGRVFGEGSAF